MFEAMLGTFILYVLYKTVDLYLPKKDSKKAILIRKHTEQSYVTAMDYSGRGYNVGKQRYLLTVSYSTHIQVEEVNVQTYSAAVVGHSVEIVKLSGRFSNKLIKFDFVI